MALDLARRGARVAVVSSGDPGVFAMAAAVLEVAAPDEWRDVPVRVLPGVTAANAVASRVGAPLGHDYAVISLSDRLKPWDVVAQRISAVARGHGDRRVQPGVAVADLAGRRDARPGARAPHPGDTGVVGRDVGGRVERVEVVRLADLDPGQVDMRTLLIVGASTTRAVDGRVFTSRRYP